MDVSRRKFFKICAGGMAGTTAAALGFAPKMALAQARNFKLLRAKEIRNTCTYCSVGCGLLMYSLGDGAKNAKEAIYHIEGDPDHPVSRGALCPKGAGLLDYVHSENRLRYPQYRAPGSDKWQRISWDEAFNRIARLMKADRDANFIEKNEQGVTVNRWLSTGMLCASAASNETGMLTQKFVRSLGMLAVDNQAREFVQEALETFRWHRQATVDEETYHALHREHRLIADVVCFPGCHINHLTPRTLDIDRVQSLMPECGIEPKALIEGPPRREVPILLRQTSFKALEEPVMFAGEHRGTHSARFGEIEQRGVALTPKGRALYDRLLQAAGTGKDNLSHQQHLQEVFSEFPDSEFLLRQQGLAWFRYRLTPTGEAHRQAFRPGDDPQPLIERGWVVAQPIIYEDFLPVSAAGIFQSNLGNETQARSHGNASREAFEAALGCPVQDEFELYRQAEERSKRRCGLL